MTRLGLLVLGFVLGIVATTALAGALLLRGGISARAEPSALESRLARAVRDRVIPSDARQARNPVAASPRVLAEGLAHFADHCATCHANDGSGRTELGRRLYPRAPDLRRPPTQGLTDGELFFIIEHGVRFTGMPGWGGEGSGEGSWHLVHFIRHLPALTAEERARMEALNPRSPAEWRALEGGGADPRDEGHGHGAPGHGGHTH